MSSMFRFVMLLFVTLMSFQDMYSDELYPRRLVREMMKGKKVENFKISGTDWKVLRSNCKWEHTKEGSLKITDIKGIVKIRCRLKTPIHIEDYKLAIVRLKSKGEGEFCFTWEDGFEINDYFGFQQKQQVYKDREFYNLKFMYADFTPGFGLVDGFYFFFPEELEEVELFNIELIAPETKTPLQIGVMGQYMDAIYDSSVVWELENIDKGDYLRFYLCILPFEWHGKCNCSISNGVKFSIKIESGENITEIFQKELQPGKEDNGLPWEPFRVNLDEYSGKPAKLLFEIDNLGDRTGDYAFWGSPVIIREKAKKELPNIFLISCDTLRPDHLLPYGYDLPTSYYLDQFAKDAVICRRAYTTIPCTPVAHASLLTGLYPENHKLTVDLPIDVNVKVLGEILQKLGYHTSGITGMKWWFLPIRGFSRGMDYYSIPENNYRNIFEVHSEVEKLLDNLSGIPLFFFIHNYDIHGKFNSGEEIYDSNDNRFRFFTDLFPYEVPEDLKKECLPYPPLNLLEYANAHYRNLGFIENLYLKAGYDNCIAKVDYALGQLFELLKSKGLYDSSLIIIVSDHGESFGEHNLYQHNDIYEATARTVSLIKFPNNQYAGMEVNDLTILEDIFPTIFDVLGIDIGINFDGIPLKRFLDNRPDDNREIFSKNIIETQMSLITNKYKLVKDLISQSEELYNLIDDPNEKIDLSLSDGTVLEQMKDKLIKQNSEWESGWVIWLKEIKKPYSVEIKYYPKEGVNKINTECFQQGIESGQLSNYACVMFRPFNSKKQGKLFFLVKDINEELTLDFTFNREVSFISSNGISKERKKNWVFNLSPDASMVFDKEPDFPEGLDSPCFAIQKIEAQKTNQDKIELPTEAIENLKALGYLE